MSHDDFAFEPVPGLPEHLPEGERILWQGSPERSGLLRHALHGRKILTYCLILLAWVTASNLGDGMAILGVAEALVLPSILVMALLLIVVGLAYGLAKSTIYTITNQRVIMRFGIALPITINLPFKKIETAGLKRHANGSGDIPLALRGNDRLAWLHLWPHARPWRFNKPEPMLRDVPEIDQVATLLTKAMAEALPEGQATLPAANAAKTTDPAAPGNLATA